MFSQKDAADAPHRAGDAARERASRGDCGGAGARGEGGARKDGAHAGKERGGSARAFYDPKLSSRGALLAASRAPRAATTDFMPVWVWVWWVGVWV